MKTRWQGFGLSLVACGTFVGASIPLAYGSKTIATEQQRVWRKGKNRGQTFSAGSHEIETKKSRRIVITGRGEDGSQHTSELHESVDYHTLVKHALEHGLVQEGEGKPSAANQLAASPELFKNVLDHYESSLVPTSVKESKSNLSASQKQVYAKGIVLDSAEDVQRALEIFAGLLAPKVNPPEHHDDSVKTLREKLPESEHRIHDLYVANFGGDWRSDKIIEAIGKELKKTGSSFTRYNVENSLGSPFFGKEVSVQKIDDQYLLRISGHPGFHPYLAEKTKAREAVESVTLRSDISSIGTVDGTSWLNLDLSGVLASDTSKGLEIAEGRVASLTKQIAEYPRGSHVIPVKFGGHDFKIKVDVTPAYDLDLVQIGNTSLAAPYKKQGDVGKYGPLEGNSQLEVQVEPGSRPNGAALPDKESTDRLLRLAGVFEQRMTPPPEEISPKVTSTKRSKK